MCVYKWFCKEDAWKSLPVLSGEFQCPHQLWIKCRRLMRSSLKWVDLCLTLNFLLMLADFLLPLRHSLTQLSGIPCYVLITTTKHSRTSCWLVNHYHLYLRLWAISVKSEFKEELKSCICVPTIASYLFLEQSEMRWSCLLCYKLGEKCEWELC